MVLTNKYLFRIFYCIGFCILQLSFTFQPISNADFIVPVEIDGTIHQVYVLKRPFVDDFLQKMGELYECVLFTASLAKVSFMEQDINLLTTVVLYMVLQYTVLDFFYSFNCLLSAHWILTDPYRAGVLDC